MDLINRYEVLKRKVIERKETFERFTKLLESETTWLISPASTRYHLSEEQGLLKHSIGVAETLLRFREFLAPAITEESCVIVGLFHDVGKLGMPSKPLYLPNDNEWLAKSRGMRYKINPDVEAMGMAVRSLYRLTQHHIFQKFGLRPSLSSTSFKSRINRSDQEDYRPAYPLGLTDQRIFLDQVLISKSVIARRRKG